MKKKPFPHLPLSVLFLAILAVTGEASGQESAPTEQPLASQPPTLTAPAGDPETAVFDTPALVFIGEQKRLPTIDLTQPPTDLWDRVRRGFAMPNLHDDAVLQQQQWYLSRPDYLERVVSRSRRYLHYIIEEIEKRGLPAELALLPMVESAYNPMAYSRSHASGIWQFIPSTGRSFKLKQNWWIDERRDVIASTSAALEYLQNIYEMHGDWHLALASYNWGEGAVARAIAKNRAKSLPTDYLSLTMPAETRQYVPKLQALKNIIANPGLYGVSLTPIANEPYFETVRKPANMDVAVAAKLAGMKVDEFVALNPAYNRPVIPAHTGQELVLPADKVDVFHSNLENHDGPLVSWQPYTLKKGEKLEKVAANFGISLAQLKQANGIKPKGRIAPGQVLLVPARNGRPTESLAKVPENLPAPPVVPESRAQWHTLKKGENLASVARRHGVGVDDLKRWNPGARIAPGQKILLAAPSQAKAAAKPASRPSGPGTKEQKAVGKTAAPVSVKPAGKAAQTYTVQRGDTLDAIARRHKVAVADLQRWNKLNGASLKPGQKLSIHRNQDS